VISFRLNGGGGYGDPGDRDPKAVAEDVADGYVSRETAKAIYGWRG
jgi:N-methylhydantoinase B/oxoprolinase/acetone carboxylase alpha subunit